MSFEFQSQNKIKKKTLKKRLYATKKFPAQICEVFAGGGVLNFSRYQNVWGETFSIFLFV